MKLWQRNIDRKLLPKNILILNARRKTETLVEFCLMHGINFKMFEEYKNSHFNISLLAQGFFNKLIIICVIFLLLMEEYNLGLLVFILSFSIFFLDPKNITEGFISYYRKN